ncbi:winged helix-turn-helix domain-containing protein [Kitasatospora sp. NPDC052896]|uniref:winged helix-turn-helix domain-containing protein n=1 Tax=Kitasatospora sp. NPDC052896 TaxID=3364061 RepID=UPI0037CAEF60
MMPLCYPRIARIHHDCSVALPATGPAAPSPAPRPVSPPAEPGPSRLQPLAALVIDDGQRTAVLEGRRLDLTYMEFELLTHLAAHPLQVLTRRQLMSSVWGQGVPTDTRTVNTHVARLRRKLGPAYRSVITTVRQVGYKFDPEAVTAAAG